VAVCSTPTPPPPHRSVPADLVGRCFNCLCTNHVAAACTNPAHCLRCHREGYQAQTCKRPRSPDAAGPLPAFNGQQCSCLTQVTGTWPLQSLLINALRCTLVKLAPPGHSSASTPEGLPSWHTLPSPPPPPLARSVTHGTDRGSSFG
jgi:hypothetical protein